MLNGNFYSCFPCKSKALAEKWSTIHWSSERLRVDICENLYFSRYEIMNQDSRWDKAPFLSSSVSDPPYDLNYIWSHDNFQMNTGTAIGQYIVVAKSVGEGA